jgi:glucose dehydrogenase
MSQNPKDWVMPAGDYPNTRYSKPKTSGVDMNKSSPTYGRPKVADQFSTDKQGEDHNVKDICPAALGTKDEQPAAYSPDTQLFYVPTSHVCMDYEPFKVS